MTSSHPPPGTETSNPRATWAVLVPFGIFCFVYPFAIVLLSFDLMPFGMEWMSSLLLAMLGLTAGAWLWLNFGWVGAAVAILVFALGIGLEYVGVTTGVPFGRYRYTGVLVPDLPGGVPLAIGFAWLSVIVGAYFTARLSLVPPSHKGNHIGLPLQDPSFASSGPIVHSPSSMAWAAIPLGALLAVGLDLLLEPVAFHVKGYWQWLEAGPGYYGVPWSNFLAWFVAALAMIALASALLRRGSLQWKWVPIGLYVMNVILFGVVNLAHGLWVPAAVGLLLLGFVWVFVVRRQYAQSRM